MTTPMGCARCGVLRVFHDADDHRYQVPDMDLIKERAAELKQRRAAA